LIDEIAGALISGCTNNVADKSLDGLPAVQAFFRQDSPGADV